MAVEMQYLPVVQDSDRAGEVNVADKLSRYGKGDVAANRWNLTATGLLSTLLSVLFFLLPSFVSARLPRRSSTPANLKPQPLHRTAYLDGLRGVAALVVFLFHFQYRWDVKPFNPYAEDHLFIQLPFIRLLLAGRSSVQLFFVISGFVLTLKPLSLIHKGRLNEALDSLSGGAFRRYFRLYLPVLAVTAITAVLRRSAIPWATTPGIPMAPLVGAAWTEQFHHWLNAFIVWANVFPIQCGTSRFDICAAPSDYDNPVWTISIEFKYSMVVFLFILVLARVRTWVRVVTVAATSIYQLSVGQVDVFVFCGGMVLAETSLLLPSGSVPGVLNLLFFRRLSPRATHLLQHALTVAVFVTSACILGYPIGEAASPPGWETLAASVPAWYEQHPEMKEHFWHSIGSVGIIFALMYSPPLRLYSKQLGSDGGDSASGPTGSSLLQKLFTNRFSQYLGFISFSMYLCHDSTISTVGTQFAVPAMHLNGKIAEAAGAIEAGAGEESVQKLAALTREYYMLWFWGYFWTIFALTWVSDVVTRAIDLPSVALTRRISKWCERPRVEALPTVHERPEAEEPLLRDDERPEEPLGNRPA